MELNFDDKLEKINRIFTVTFWIVTGIISLVIMYYVAANKTIVIADSNSDEMQIAAVKSGGSGRELLLVRDDKNVGKLNIPLEKNVKAEDVVVENQYWESALRIYIGGADENFYEETPVSGDLSPIVQGVCEAQEEGMLLTFMMDGIYEYHTTMNDNVVTISYEKPDKLYDMIVIIDPACGGSDEGEVLRGFAEKTLTLQVAELVRDRMNNSNVKVFLTRTDDRDLSDDSRLDLIDKCSADLYIKISVNTSADRSIYGITGVYNADYFIPGFGNVELADLVTRNVTIASGNRANGLEPAGEDSILSSITIPAAQVKIGYFSNEKESALLTNSDYKVKIAQGIVDAIEGAYTSIYGE